MAAVSQGYAHLPVPHRKIVQAGDAVESDVAGVGQRQVRPDVVAGHAGRHKIGRLVRRHVSIEYPRPAGLLDVHQRLGVAQPDAANDAHVGVDAPPAKLSAYGLQCLRYARGLAAYGGSDANPRLASRLQLLETSLGFLQ